MTEGFITVSSTRPGVAHVSAWIQVERRESRVRGNVVMSDGKLLPFAGAIVCPGTTDAEADSMIEEAAKRYAR